MANVIYENYILANEIEDQFDSHLDLARFCTIDKTLEGVAGMKKIINRYSATDGTEKLAMGAGNTKNIEVDYTPEEYRILMAQNRFKYFDEQEMTDPMIVTTGVRHMAVDMFNTVNADVFAEFNKATLSHTASTPDFGCFADAAAELNVEALEGLGLFAFVFHLRIQLAVRFLVFQIVRIHLHSNF